MGIFEIAVSRAGEAIHENSAPLGTPNPLLAAARLVGLFEARGAELARNELPWTGPESYFVGILQGGDFYNRVPTACRIVGTRRYAAERSFEEVSAEVGSFARQVERETGAKVDVKFTKTRDGFRLREDEPLVKALGRAYSGATGGELPLMGWRSVADAPVFNREGGIPATYHSPGGEGAHADVEFVPIAGLVRAAKVYLLTAAYFCGY
jgi:acetylornithine deacetylase